MSRSSRWSRAAIRVAAGLCLTAIAAAGVACRKGPTLALTDQLEARKLGSNLRVQFAKAADASNRAVMAVTDEASSAAAREAAQATQQVDHDVDALQRLLQQLAYTDDVRHLDAFKACFAGFKALDADILPLAVENTNIKAQRLSFGPAREAAKDFRQALQAAGRSKAANNSCCVDAEIAKATGALLEVQATQARHIAESDEAAMTQMETEMAASQTAARKALESLKGQLPGGGAQLADAAAALDRFAATNSEIVKLSRRNSNVRSLALSLGRKRTVTAQCDDNLLALEDALARHDFTATR